jgi:hypothetical protein
MRGVAYAFLACGVLAFGALASSPASAGCYSACGDNGGYGYGPSYYGSYGGYGYDSGVRSYTSYHQRVLTYKTTVYDSGYRYVGGYNGGGYYGGGGYLTASYGGGYSGYYRSGYYGGGYHSGYHSKPYHSYHRPYVRSHHHYNPYHAPIRRAVVSAYGCYGPRCL